MLGTRDSTTSGSSMAPPEKSATRVVVVDGNGKTESAVVHELNLRNLLNTSSGAAASASVMTGGSGARVVMEQQQKRDQAPPPVIPRRIAPLSPKLQRKIYNMRENCQRMEKAAATYQSPIKLSDLDAIVPRDYVTSELQKKQQTMENKGAKLVDDSIGLTSIDMLNQIQKQINDMEVQQKQNQTNNNRDIVDDSLEDVSEYKEMIKISKRYGEKDNLNMKHGTSGVASNQLLGYLGAYSDKQSNEPDDDENGNNSEDDHNKNKFQRGTVRNSTGGVASMTAKQLLGKSKGINRTASDTKNMETKVKMMREQAATSNEKTKRDSQDSIILHTHQSRTDSGSNRVNASPGAKRTTGFLSKPRILGMNEKNQQLCHQVTPPQRQQQNPQPAAVTTIPVSNNNNGGQNAHSRQKYLEQVNFQTLRES